MSALIPFGPVAPSAKPVFDPPDGWKYRVDGVQMVHRPTYISHALAYALCLRVYPTAYRPAPLAHSSWGLVACY